MKKFTLVTSLFLPLVIACFASVAHSKGLPLERWQRATVKVKSFTCAAPNLSREGSGVLVRMDSKVLIVTSEHVVFQDKSERFCNTVSSENGRQAKALLIGSDVLMGLAVLEVSGATEFSADVIEFSELLHDLSVPTDPDEAVALGFPFGSARLQTLRQGSVLNSRSERALIPGQKYLFEISNLPLEYGMSGGLFIQRSKQTDRFVFRGLLSHQYLKREAGRPSIVSEANARLASTDLGFAIRGLEVAQWLKKQSSSPSIQWRRDPNAQIRGLDSLAVGPLLFTLKDLKGGKARKIGGADGSGIGGGRVPGGEDLQSTSEDGAVFVEVTLDPKASAELRSLDFGNDQLNAWTQQLLRGRSVKIAMMIDRVSLEKEEFVSLAQFLTLWLRNGFRPVAESGLAMPRQIEEQLLRVARNIAILENASILPEHAAHLAFIRERVELLRNGFISVQAAGQAVFENRQIWEGLYTAEFEKTVSVETEIRRLLSLFQQHRVE